jgi:hypothetical protein
MLRRGTKCSIAVWLDQVKNEPEGEILGLVLKGRGE